MAEPTPFAATIPFPELKDGLATRAHPFLKWAGGKAKLAPVILDKAPGTFGSYHEPFVGAGAVYFPLSAARPGMPATLNDLNEALMETYLGRSRPP